MSDRQTQREPSAARANLEERTTAVARPPSTTTSPSFPAFANPTLVQQTLSSPPATYLPTPLHSSLDQLRCSPPSPSLLRSRSPLVSARSPPRPPVPFHAKSLTSDSPSPSLLSSSQLCSLLTARDRTLSLPETSATRSVSCNRPISSLARSSFARPDLVRPRACLPFSTPPRVSPLVLSHLVSLATMLPRRLRWMAQPGKERGRKGTCRALARSLRRRPLSALGERGVKDGDPPEGHVSAPAARSTRLLLSPHTGLERANLLCVCREIDEAPREDNTIREMIAL